mgnify:FL=1
MTFQSIKDEYERQREEERRKLIRYLQGNSVLTSVGLSVGTAASGRGKKTYTSNKRFAEYDLRNWKWVECRNDDGGFQVVVSLNMPETDINSGNAHCLYDRIGLQVSYTADENFYSISIYTGIDLPLCDENMVQITDAILQQYAMFLVLMGSEQNID